MAPLSRSAAMAFRVLCHPCGGWPTGCSPTQGERAMRSLPSALAVQLHKWQAQTLTTNQTAQVNLPTLEEFNGSCAISLDHDLSVYFVAPFWHDSITLASPHLLVPGTRSCAALCAVRMKVQCLSAPPYARYWEALGGKSNQPAPGEFAASSKSPFIV